MKIGFIGLGIMGRPMAKNLVKAGYDLTVYDLNEEAVADLVSCRGRQGQQTAVEKHHWRQVVIHHGPNSVRSGVGKMAWQKKSAEGTVLIDMSSIDPWIHWHGAEKYGIEMMDAPVSGGEPKATMVVCYLEEPFGIDIMTC